MLEAGEELQLASHYTASPSVAGSQRALFEYLRQSFPGRVSRVAARVTGQSAPDLPFPSDEAREPSQRTRSFMFLVIGAIVARRTGFHEMLMIAENGQMAIHLPLTPGRIGAFSTHTAHPEFVHEMEGLSTPDAVGATHSPQSIPLPDQGVFVALAGTPAERPGQFFIDIADLTIEPVQMLVELLSELMSGHGATRQHLTAASRCRFRRKLAGHAQPPCTGMTPHCPTCGCGLSARLRSGLGGVAAVPRLYCGLVDPVPIGLPRPDHRQGLGRGTLPPYKSGCPPGYYRAMKAESLNARLWRRCARPTSRRKHPTRR